MLLGISGKSMSGKDTTADYLIERGVFDSKISFADNLKEACKSIFNLNSEQLFTQAGKAELFTTPVVTDKYLLTAVIAWMGRTHDIALENKNYDHLIGVELLKPRDVLQFVGTEVMRFYSPNYHCEALLRSLSIKDNVIITDVRFINEASAVVNSGGYVVRIERPESLKGSAYNSVCSSHASETSLDFWDKWSYILYNNTSNKSSLYKEIDKMVKYIWRCYDSNNTKTKETLPIT